MEQPRRLECAAHRWQHAIPARQARIVVVGLGYVGLAIGMRLAEQRFSVTGLERDRERLDRIRSARTEADAGRLLRLMRRERLQQTIHPECLAEVDVVLICVPTPLTAGHPDHSMVLAAARMVAMHAPEGALVILESTVAPGFVEEQLEPVLCPRLVAFSPERVDPCHPILGTSRLVSGTTREARDAADLLYRCAGVQTHLCADVKEAEYAKLLENAHRLVNIALVDQFAGLCRRDGVSIDGVLSAAATKPLGYTPFQAGPGAGGHCIPVDPAFAVERARELGHQLPLVELALACNRARPGEVAQAVLELGAGQPEPSAVLVGVSYKPGVADTRESAANEVHRALCAAGWRVMFHDSLVNRWQGMSSVPLSRALLSSVTVVVLVSPHDDVERSLLLAHEGPIVDARGFLNGCAGANVVRV